LYLFVKLFAEVPLVTLPLDEYTRKHFLSGVGFTETQIEYLPSFLTSRSIEYHSLFISYAHQDEVLAQRLHTCMRKKDVPCWFAPHDLQLGDYFRERIDQAIHTQDKLLLLLSRHSVQSGWVRYEVELALARENRERREILFPIRLDDAIFQCTASWAISLLATRHIGNFTNWQDDEAYQLALTTLLRHLKVTVPPVSSHHQHQEEDFTR
jgi:TIR domain